MCGNMVLMIRLGGNEDVDNIVSNIRLNDKDN